MMVKMDQSDRTQTVTGSCKRASVTFFTAALPTICDRNCGLPSTIPRCSVTSTTPLTYSTAHKVPDKSRRRATIPHPARLNCSLHSKHQDTLPLPPSQTPHTTLLTRRLTKADGVPQSFTPFSTLPTFFRAKRALFRHFGQSREIFLHFVYLNLMFGRYTTVVS